MLLSCKRLLYINTIEHREKVYCPQHRFLFENAEELGNVPRHLLQNGNPVDLLMQHQDTFVHAAPKHPNAWFFAVRAAGRAGKWTKQNRW